MKHPLLSTSFLRPLALLLTVAALTLLQSCKTEIEPRPLADINTLKGKWASISTSGAIVGYEFDFDPAARSSVFTKVPVGNVYGFKVGEVNIKNVEAVDATTFRGETRYRGAGGFYYYADIKITVSGDVLTYSTDSGSISSSLTVTGQTGQYQRVK